jgi:hypothetical protein
VVNQTAGSRGQILDVIIRDSPASNVVADAQGMAQVYQREAGAAVARSTIDGRVVYRQNYLASTTFTVCRHLLTVNARSSVEARLTSPPGSARAACGPDDLPRVLAERLPSPDNNARPPRSGRPTELFALDPCNLVGDDLRTELGLGKGDKSTRSISPECQHIADSANRVTVDPRGIAVVNNLGIKFQKEEAGRMADNADAPSGRVNGRAYYKSRPIGIGLCDYTIEVSVATSVKITAGLSGSDSHEIACQIVSRVAPRIESRLPPLAV